MQHRLTNRTCLATLALVAMMLPLSGVAQQIYRWKDAQGKVHFTHTPPPDTAKIEKTITPTKAPPPPPPSSRSLGMNGENGGSGHGGMAGNGLSETDRVRLASECRQARGQLKAMAGGEKVVRSGSDGKPMPLEGAARAQEMQRLRDFVLKSCNS